MRGNSLEGYLFLSLFSLQIQTRLLWRELCLHLESVILPLNYFFVYFQVDQKFRRNMRFAKKHNKLENTENTEKMES